MNVIGLRGYLDAKVSTDGHFGFWVQVGDNPEARRLVDGSDLIYEGDMLAFPENVKQWIRNATAYQRGMPMYSAED